MIQYISWSQVKDFTRVCAKTRVICQCKNGRNITMDAEHPNNPKDGLAVQRMGLKLKDLMNSSEVLTGSKGQMPMPLGLKTMNTKQAFRIVPMGGNVPASPIARSPPQASTPGRTVASSPESPSESTICISDTSPQRTSPVTPKTSRNVQLYY